jgi:hypothetical protein
VNQEREEALRAFVGDMRAKLEANEHKGSWRETPYFLLMRGLRDELEELADALIGQNWEAVIKESADVANFAMMIADRARRAKRDCSLDSLVTGDTLRDLSKLDEVAGQQ